MSALTAEQIRQLDPRQFIDICERHVHQNFERHLTIEQVSALSKDYSRKTREEFARLQDELVEKLVDSGFKATFSDPNRCRDWIGLWFAPEGHSTVYQILMSYV